MKISYTGKFLFFRVFNTERANSLVLFLILLMLTAGADAQVSQGKPSKEAAIAAWNGGRYQEAYDQFNGLLLLYSRDPLYKYYTGACLVRLEGDMTRAVSLLSSAISSSAGVKSVPADVWFYYGRSLQMSGSYSEASDAYQKFTKSAGKKVSQEYGVQKYIDECSAGKGALSPQQAVPVAVAVQGKEVVKEVTVEVPVPESYSKPMKEALALQYSADSLSREADSRRRKMEGADPQTKQSLKKEADSLDNEAASRRAAASALLVGLQPPDSVEKEAAAVAEPDYIEAVVTVKDSATAETTAGVPVFGVFEVRPSPAYSQSNPVPVGTGAPDGLVYRIQLAAFRNAVQPDLFKGLYPLYGKTKPENGVTFYYVGMFRTSEAARQALTDARNAGFPDAFVIAMMNDQQISAEKAAQLEKEWAQRPLFYLEPDKPAGSQGAGAEALPVGTLIFRAEVMRSKKTVKPDVVEKMQLLAGTRGLDIVKNSSGETQYLIGNFITFESASDYVSLLVRNGYSDAKVAAFVGSAEIPLETAKELINKLNND